MRLWRNFITTSRHRKRRTHYVNYINFRTGPSADDPQYTKAAASHDENATCNIIARHLVERLGVPIQDATVSEGRARGSNLKLCGYVELAWSPEDSSEYKTSKFYVTKDDDVPFDVVLGPKLVENDGSNQQGLSASGLSGSRPSHGDIPTSSRGQRRRTWFCF